MSLKKRERQLLLLRSLDISNGADDYLFMLLTKQMHRVTNPRTFSSLRFLIQLCSHFQSKMRTLYQRQSHNVGLQTYERLA